LGGSFYAFLNFILIPGTEKKVAGKWIYITVLVLYVKAASAPPKEVGKVFINGLCHPIYRFADPVLP
jgi:hypothetical protein